MKIISLIGHPIIIENHTSYARGLEFIDKNTNLIIGYHKKGDTIQGLKLEKNHYFNDKKELFEQYHTFENENGIGKAGKKKSYINKYAGASELIYVSNTPFFVGDIVEDNIFIGSCVSSLNVNKSTYINYVQLAHKLPAAALKKNIDNDYYQAINEGFKEIKESFSNLKDAFNTGSVGVPVKGWTPSAPNSIAWNAKIEKAQAQIDKKLQKMEKLIL